MATNKSDIQSTSDDTLRSVAGSIAAKAIKDGSPVKSYMIAVLDEESADAFAADSGLNEQFVGAKRPGNQVIVLPNCGIDKRVFAMMASMRLWQAGASAVCFIGDVVFINRPPGTDLSTIEAPSQAADHKSAWMAILVEQSCDIDALFIEYKDNEEVSRTDWGSDDSKSFCGPMSQVLLTALAIGTGRDRGIGAVQ